MKRQKYLPVLTLILLAAGSLPFTACSVRPREDVRSITYSVPALAGPDCSKLLLQILARTNGVIEANPDITNKTISVKYNSRTTAQKNLEHAIAAAGFDVEDTPANPAAKAKLPAGCQ